MLATPSPPAVAAGPVAVVIGSPTADQSYAGAPVQLSGSVSSSQGTIAAVRYTVQDRFTLLYLHADGSLGAYHAFGATMDQPGTNQSGWSAVIQTIPPDEYTLSVTATDSTSAKGSASVRFAIAPVNPTGPGYLTIQWGRSIYAPTNSAKTCQPIPNTLSIIDEANDLQSHGYSGTGTVVVDRTNATSRYCDSANAYSSWSDLATLRDTYGWTFVSDGLTHNDITKMSAAQQQQESCGSLQAFTDNGHTRAGGLFAYGDNRYNTTVQTNVVSTCFAFGRTYRGGRNFLSHMGAPWFQSTNSILGGNCTQVGAPCYTAITTNVHYNDPQQIANLFNVPGDEWVDVQFYRLVTGVSTFSPQWSWDCSNADWHLHWTSQTEMYCLNDFDWALAQIPPSVVVTDPATVGAAWGRPIPGT